MRKVAVDINKLLIDKFFWRFLTSFCASEGLAVNVIFYEQNWELTHHATTHESAFLRFLWDIKTTLRH